MLHYQKYYAHIVFTMYSGDEIYGCGVYYNNMTLNPYPKKPRVNHRRLRCQFLILFYESIRYYLTWPWEGVNYVSIQAIFHIIIVRYCWMIVQIKYCIIFFPHLKAFFVRERFHVNIKSQKRGFRRIRNDLV